MLVKQDDQSCVSSGIDWMWVVCTINCGDSGMMWFHASLWIIRRSNVLDIAHLSGDRYEVGRALLQACLINRLLFPYCYATRIRRAM